MVLLWVYELNSFYPSINHVSSEILEGGMFWFVGITFNNIIFKKKTTFQSSH